MATLYITEYAELVRLPNNVVAPIGKEPKVAGQTESITGSSTQTNAFNVNTNFVMVHTDAICSIKFGADPEAAATDDRLAANETRFYGVGPGLKLAVISNT